MSKYSLIIAEEIWTGFSNDKQKKIQNIAEKYSCEIVIESNMRSLGHDEIIHLICNMPSCLLPKGEWDTFSNEMWKATGWEGDDKV